MIFCLLVCCFSGNHLFRYLDISDWWYLYCTKVGIYCILDNRVLFFVVCIFHSTQACF